ncbi:SGNH/GDSL hydrolase family protein [Massilia sp.]|uniref:SGNH/GDSL hydrolase family protein n=1 Tax=Massilia sp. TaxID=1882437 RepID=UPI00289C86D0|nr:SGNH/GDSL hydrolase family protein [Massilia sp.]
MRQKNFALALLTAAALAACGGTGSSGGDQSHPITFSQQVTFGDSLSDVGSYNVGAVKAAGGGRFTINGVDTAKNPALTGLNWTEVLAAELRLPAPCAAQTGLEGTAPGFNVPIVNNVNCYNYAQGGARVTNPIGAGNKANKPEFGEMTVPVVTQIQNHLAKVGGSFKGTELVTIMAGGNDVLMQLAAVSAAGTRAGQQAFPSLLIAGLVAATKNPASAQAIGAAVQQNAANGQTAIVNAAVTAAVMNGATQADAVAAATKAAADAQAAGTKAAGEYAAANAQTLVGELGRAGAEKAALVNQLVAKGAKYVIVNNLPDVANTPSGRAQPALQPLIDTMVNTFNAQLKANLDPKYNANVLYVDLYTISKDQMTNPRTKEIYGLTNVTTPACDLTKTKDTSLLCTTNTLVAGDAATYMYADTIHPTPYEYWLVARYVLKDMAVKGWL